MNMVRLANSPDEVTDREEQLIAVFQRLTGDEDIDEDEEEVQEGPLIPKMVGDAAQEKKIHEEGTHDHKEQRGVSKPTKLRGNKASHTKRTTSDTDTKRNASVPKPNLSDLGLANESGCELSCFTAGQRTKIFRPRASPSKGSVGSEEQKKLCKRSNEDGSCFCFCY
jgi:hypothetical protein